MLKYKIQTKLSVLNLRG